MKNDLSKVQISDWIWTIKYGWEKCVRLSQNPYRIITELHAYTTDGKYAEMDRYPSAFTEPPDCFNAEPKPCEFNTGDRVLVRDDKCGMWHRKYFSHMNDDGLYVCFRCDHDGWSSYGRCKGWEQCKKWEDEK